MRVPSQPHKRYTAAVSIPENLRPIVVGVVGAVAAFFVFRSSGGGKGSDPLDAIPRDSFLVATVDMGELRRSPVYLALAGDKDGETDAMIGRALGIGRLKEACGFDPSSRVLKIAAAVPEESSDKGDFGLAARVDVTEAELEKCAHALADKRGGHAEIKQERGFAVLETSEGPSGARIAYGKDHLLVVGKGAWFDAMLAAADHVKPGVRDAQAHAAVRASMTSHEGWKNPTVLVSAVLPQSLRDRLKREMGVDRADDPSNTMMGGVLDVASIGFAVRAGETGGNVDAAVELVCEGADACVAVEKLVQKKRFDWAKDLTMRMIGLGPVFDSFQVKRDGIHLRATASASANGLASTLERILRFRSRPSADMRPPPVRPPPRPDETFGRDAGAGGAGGAGDKKP